MCKETGYLTSWWSHPPRRNMAGIGVTGETSTNDPHSDAWAFKTEDSHWYKGYSFPDWKAAVQAHYAHMSAYCFASEINNASHVDPRYTAAKQFFKSKGIQPAKVLTDLNGVWAVPGTTYGQTIEQLLKAATPVPNIPLNQPSNSNLPCNSEWAVGVQGVICSEFGPGKVNSPGSYVRTRPSLDPTIGKVLRKLDRDTLLHFIGYTDSGPEVKGGGTRWYLISSADGGGWIYSKLVS
jgi:hypothetical protein